MSVVFEEGQQEQTMVRLIVKGHGDRYVAAQLLVSLRTFYRLLERLMLRYGLPNRAALGAFAASRGWLPDYPPSCSTACTVPDRGEGLAISGS